MRASKNEDGRGIFKSFEGSSKGEGLDGGNKWNDILTLPELLAGLQDDKRPNNSWYQLGNTWNDERNNKRKLEESILGEREDGGVEPNIQWNNHCRERQEEAADQKSGGLNIHRLFHEVIRQHLNTVRKGEHNDTREGCGQQQQHDTILKPPHKAVITALCRSKSDVAFKDDGKKGILISLQKPNIDIISSSSFADKCSHHHHQLFKIPVDALSKLLHDAVLEEETQLPAAASSDGSPHSSTSTLHSSLTASVVPQTKNQQPSSTRAMLSTKTRRIRYRMRRQTEKRRIEWCNSSSSSEDLD